MVSHDKKRIIKAAELAGAVSGKYAIIEMNELNVIYKAGLY